MTIKQQVRIAQNYELIISLPEKFKVKHIDGLNRRVLHSLRHAELIERVPDSMGKETVWTLTDTAEEMLENRGPEYFRWVPDLSNKQLRFLIKHQSIIEEHLSSVDDTFRSSDVEIDGRTPEGMRRYGIIEKVESRLGYATVWGLTELGEKICKMACDSI